MRVCVALLAALLLATVPLAATPVCGAGSLADYIRLVDGCQIGDKIFYDFGYTASAFGGAGAIPADGVSVTPLDVALNPGFFFTAPWGVGPGQGMDSHITYSVVVLRGGAPIKDISARLEGYGTVNDGLILVGESVLPLEISLALAFGQGLNVTSATAEFDPTFGPLFVAKDIALFGNRGAAIVSGVFNQFSEIPEPAAMLLVGSGLLGLGLLRKRS